MNEKTRLYIECACDHPDHVIRVTYWPDDDDHEVYVDVHLRQYDTFWYRLKACVRYLFGQDVASSESCILRPEDADKLQAVVDMLRTWRSK